MANSTQAAFDARVGIGLGTDVDEEGAAPVADTGFSFTIHDDLSGVEADWRAFEPHADLTAFQTFDWLSAWQRHIGARNGVTPAIAVVRQRGDIVCIWPLAVERRGRVCRAVWLGADLSNYNSPLLARDFAARVDAAAFTAMWQAIKRKICDAHHVDLFELDKMPDSIGAQPNPMLALPVMPYHTGAYMMRLGSSWDAFYAEKRSAKTRRTERKKRNRLAEHGEIRFATATEPADIERSLATMIEQKSVSYAELGVDNIFDPPGHRDFFIDFATRHRELAHVSRLDIGELVAAANFALVFRGRYLYIVASYHHGEVARFGPGNAHLHEMMRYAIERGLKEFDFTIGDEPYKRDWYDTEIKMFDLVVPMTLRGYATAAPMMAMRKLKAFILRHPKLWAAVRRTRSAIGALRKRNEPKPVAEAEV